MFDSSSHVLLEAALYQVKLQLKLPTVANINTSVCVSLCLNTFKLNYFLLSSSSYSVLNFILGSWEPLVVTASALSYFLIYLMEFLVDISDQILKDLRPV